MNISTMTIDLARKILDTCRQRARELGSPVSIAIVDAGGHLVLFERMMTPHGFATGDISIAKAHTSVMFNQSTEAVAQWAAAIPGFSASLAAMTDGKFVLAAGGWPIRVDSITLGGLGVSGGNAPGRDDDIARAGLAVLKSSRQPPATYYQPSQSQHPQPVFNHQSSPGYAISMEQPTPSSHQNIPERTLRAPEQPGGPRNLAPNDIHPLSNSYSEDKPSSSSNDRSGDDLK